MTEAIHAGLTYGFIAGFAVLGFALTLVFLFAFIELGNQAFNIWDRIRGDEHERGTDKGGDD